jgi:hypothetical protein
MEALPAADYLAVAIDSLPQNAWSNTQVLEQLAPLAVPFRLADGEQRTIQLRLSQTPAGLRIGE